MTSKNGRLSGVIIVPRQRLGRNRDWASSDLDLARKAKAAALAGSDIVGRCR
jgi:hypothetical protein